MEFRALISKGELAASLQAEGLELVEGSWRNVTRGTAA